MSATFSFDDISESDEPYEEFIKKQKVEPMQVIKKPSITVQESQFKVPIATPKRAFRVTATGAKILIPTRDEELELKKRIEKTKQIAEEKKKQQLGYFDAADPLNGVHQVERAMFGEYHYERLMQFRTGKRFIYKEKTLPRWRREGYEIDSSKADYKYDSQVYGKYVDVERVFKAEKEAIEKDYNGVMEGVVVKWVLSSIALPPQYIPERFCLNPKFAPAGNSKYMLECYDNDIKSLCIPYFELVDGTYLPEYRYTVHNVPSHLLGHPLMWYYDSKEHYEFIFEERRL